MIFCAATKTVLFLRGSGDIMNTPVGKFLKLSETFGKLVIIPAKRSMEDPEIFKKYPKFPMESRKFFESLTKLPKDCRCFANFWGTGRTDKD